MKTLSGLCFAALLATTPSCTPATPDGSRTPEAESMLATLKALPAEGAFMFGHHDDPVYGIGWDGDTDRSDVRSVCGDYPAIMSFDLGHIEHGRAYSLDSVPFDRIRRECVAQYERGGMVSFSWHVDNPLTGGSSWDVSGGTKVVESVLPGGANHDAFIGWIDRVADFLNSITTESGVKVPALFRPWHEHTGSWFWWGQEHCTDEEYLALWQMTYQRMSEKGTDQLLWAYSPGIEPQDTTGYLARYPGDSIVDLIGVDCYQYDSRADYLANLDRLLRIMQQVSATHGKPMAVTETGLEGVTDPAWWTATLMPAVASYPVSYVLVWRNARERPGHFYAPYPGHASAADFVQFYEDPRTLFARDMKELSAKNK